MLLRLGRERFKNTPVSSIQPLLTSQLQTTFCEYAKLPKAIWAKRSEVFYTELYNPKGKVAKQPQSSAPTVFIFFLQILKYSHYNL